MTQWLLLFLAFFPAPRAQQPPAASLFNAPPCTTAGGLPGRVSAASGDCVAAAPALVPPALRVLHGATFAAPLSVGRSEPPGGRTPAQLALAGAPEGALRGAMLGPARAAFSLRDGSGHWGPGADASLFSVTPSSGLEPWEAAAEDGGFFAPLGALPLPAGAPDALFLAVAHGGAPSQPNLINVRLAPSATRSAAASPTGSPSAAASRTPEADTRSPSSSGSRSPSS